MRLSRLVSVMLVGLFVIVSSVGAYAVEKQHDKQVRMKGEGMIKKMCKHLDLTKEQEEKLTSLTKDAEDEIKELRQKNKDLMGKIREEMQKDDPSVNRINDFIREAGKNKIEIQIKRMGVMLEFRKELTTEQKEELKKMHQKRMEMMKNGKDEREESCPGKMKDW